MFVEEALAFWIWSRRLNGLGGILGDNQPPIGNNEILSLTAQQKTIAYRNLTYPDIRTITKDRQSNTTTIIDYGREADTSKKGDQQFEFDDTKTRLYQAFQCWDKKREVME